MRCRKHGASLAIEPNVSYAEGREPAYKRPIRPAPSALLDTPRTPSARDGTRSDLGTPVYPNVSVVCPILRPIVSSRSVLRPMSVIRSGHGQGDDKRAARG